jgi:hypothetical protein
MDNASAQDNALPVSNVSHANITGKVPQKITKRRGGKRKAVKLSSDQRRHVKQLTKSGQISPRAAASHGLAGKK